MDIKEIEHRNQVLRAYCEGRDWDSNNEYALKRKLVLNSTKLLSKYQYVVEDEWEVEPSRSDKGRGDLVFTDGSGRFAVVEVKWIDIEGGGRTGSTKRTSNRKKRRKLEEQAIDYANRWSKRFDINQVEAYIFTNEQDCPMIPIKNVSPTQKD